jgi:hypothetical protein
VLHAPLRLQRVVVRRFPLDQPIEQVVFVGLLLLRRKARALWPRRAIRRQSVAQQVVRVLHARQRSTGACLRATTPVQVDHAPKSMLIDSMPMSR